MFQKLVSSAEFFYPSQHQAYGNNKSYQDSFATFCCFRKFSKCSCYLITKKWQIKLFISSLCSWFRVDVPLYELPTWTVCILISHSMLWLYTQGKILPHKLFQFIQAILLIEFGVNDTSTHVGHFVSSHKERKERREIRGDEREGQGRKRTGMKVKKQKKQKRSPPTLACYKDSRHCPTVSQSQLDTPVK